MDPITLIITALAAGAIAGAEGTASQAVQDAYAGLKALLQRRFAGRPSGETAMEQHEARPEAWRGALEAELVHVEAGADPDVVDAARQMMELVDLAGAQSGKYRVVVHGSQGVQVGEHNKQTNTFGAPPSA